jgi:hypothetical protein
LIVYWEVFGPLFAKLTSLLGCLDGKACSLIDLEHPLYVVLTKLAIWACMVQLLVLRWKQYAADF